ncbi:metallo-hydrolase oxidoreductase [Lasallia pustulata]|uniref:Metallo-hydrolase oxidoreductase n=1 Tax=Lasallia pustulata TaxID=136370 RepID=A0A1W5D3S2_9LECA|nr:metallo-hydrolase oxidoreductase [Lasallia pustulata]
MKSKGKANGSILNFFKKAEPGFLLGESGKDNGESLFIEDDEVKEESTASTQGPTPPWDISTPPKSNGGSPSDNNSARYNEDNGSVKRRRLDDTVKEEVCSPPPWKEESLNPLNESPSGTDSISRPAPDTLASQQLDLKRAGPFIEDSDSEDEALRELSKEVFGSVAQSSSSNTPVTVAHSNNQEQSEKPNTEGFPPVATFEREATSIVGGDGFEGFEDFIDDEFPEDGEEYMERRWMEEQRDLEIGLEDGEEEEALDAAMKEEEGLTLGLSIHEAEDSSCPICSASFAALSDQEASVHVNGCLDGKPVPLPNRNSAIKFDPAVKQENGGVSAKRFQRSAIARPGQDNPFSLGASNPSSSSAFSKLMSSHAEDEAWATAAASETAARGKPAYQRTCPFYKILPGFFICVDAFRYGAVEGCKAYFLSHFHSDHYIGLTSSWCHGPIYCSRVTANLVRQQLRVDPKWVFDLEFDRKIEVPGTQCVEVTMIPANHCPGSSLYLFEKVVGKGRNPKKQRVLHCGDFRACPAHVQHPLLRPDVIDAVTGKQTGQQKLDVCYLDTTYLTPKYAFPSQEQVIKACADMCVSLNKERVDENDNWEQTKKERAGSGMVRFVRKDSDLIKEEQNDDDVDAMKGKTKVGTRSRGRLLVIVGTYSIGKERICLGVARALRSKIYAPPSKQKICAALEDPELTSLLTSNPLDAQVHMQMLMEIRAETLADYLTGYKPHFSRIVGFRPSGWNYRPPNSRFVESPAVQTVLHSESWRSRYGMAELVPQRGSTREASCFGVPYSEHSSFRELTMFCCALRIDRIIPTVNVGSAKSREKMRGWCEKWAAEKKKNGLFRVGDGVVGW